MPRIWPIARANRSILAHILGAVHGSRWRHMSKLHGSGILHPAIGRALAMDRAALRALRIAKGMTQEAMAYRLCLSPRHYKRLESGQTRISASLAKLARHELK